MARMYPDFLQISDKVSAAEYALYHAFQEQLDNGYVVFHSVAWQARGKNGRPQDGEADFVVAHPEYGILVIEVKGGNIRFSPRANRWESVSEGNKSYEIKDPFVQARVAKYTLLDVLKNMMKRTAHINMGHAVAFPDVVIGSEMLGADKPRAIVLDHADSADLNTWLQQAMAYWRGANTFTDTAPGRNAMSALLYLLGRTRDLRPALWGIIRHEQQDMVRLTEEQFFVLDMLERQTRAAIAGCAGSGKTLLAVEKATRLARSGFKVLLTCYNRNLVNFLKKRVGDESNLDITNFHKLCFDLAREADMLPIQTENKSDFYTHLLPEAMMESADVLEHKYDAIVVDEGQDFNEAWWIPLQSLLHDPDDGCLYIFYDDNQQIYGRKRVGFDDQALIPHPSSFPISTPPFLLTINCRNTRSIHRQVSRFYRAQVPTQARGPRGRPVTIKRYNHANQLHAKLTDEIRRLTRDEKIPPHEIAILTPLSRRKSNLWLSDGFRGIRYSEAWPTEPDQIHCNTIQAFKGLESTVVILAEVDRWSARPKDLDPLLYVACSRAKNHLVVLLPDSAPSTLHRRFAS